MKRALAIAFSLLTAGCVTDNGAGFVDSVSAISSALTAQDTLEFDLRKDLARRSNELEFMSNGTYSCGEPKSSFIADSEEYYRDLNRRNVKKPIGWNVVLELRKKDRENDELLKAVLTYGNQMKALTSDFEYAKGLVGVIKGEVAALKQGGGLSDAGSVLTGLNAVLVIAEQSAGGFEAAAVQHAAAAMQEGLALAAKRLSADAVLAGLTKTEAIAFRYWDACQTERLRFYRDYYYPIRKQKEFVNGDGQPYYQGTAKSSVIDFAREYRQYQLDREAFISRRPNFVSLINNVVEANKKIIEAPDRDAILAAGKALVDTTTAIQPAAVTLASR
ncbi:hypothetical protein [Bradyrhizobium sp. Ce-3]|uniref:hypothetical protein n=1 Tax=Bradyrhizobium sp. Ce-3 TaxID=2913970 RepID=UPI001FC8665B|nr:hypothetical protein [Bradyrhizobium sp. Ce-3]